MVFLGGIEQYVQRGPTHWIDCIVVGLLLRQGHWTDAQGGVASLGISWAAPCARNAGVRIRLLPVRRSTYLQKIRRFSHIFGMASALKLLAALTPPPFVQPVDYDGLEYKWKMFVFRPERMSLVLGSCNSFSPPASVQGRSVSHSSSLVLYHMVPDRFSQEQEEGRCMARLFTKVFFFYDRC